MGLTRKVAKNTIFQLVGKVLTTVFSLLLVTLIARKLGVSEFGNYTAIVSYGQFFAIFADLGVNIYLIKRITDPGVDEAEEVGSMLGLRIATAIVVIILAYVLMFILPYSAEIRIGIAVVMWAIFAQTVNSLFVSVLQAKLEMYYAALTEVVGRFSVLAFTFIALLFSRNLIWIILSVTLGGAINLYLTYYFSKNFVRFKLIWQPKMWVKILMESLPISVTAVLSFIYFKIDSVLMSFIPIHNKINSVELGIYGSAYKVIEILQLLPGILLGNIFPVITNYVATKNEKLRSVIQRSFDVLAVLGLPITAFVFIYSKQIINIIVGPEFSLATKPLQILAFAVFLNYFSGLFCYIALALNKQISLIYVYLTAAIFNVATNLIFIPIYSYTAASVITLVTQVIVLIGSFSICRKELAIIPSFKNTSIVSLIVIFISAIAWFGMRDWNIFIVLVLLATLYLGLILATKVFSSVELKRVLTKQR